MSENDGELSVLRQLLKHAKLWYRFEDYEPLANTKAPVGRALTETEQAILFAVAQSRSDWLYAFTAGVLGAYCGMRACEIKAVRWQDVDLVAGVLEIKRSKTPAGWRSPTLNTVCRETLSQLRAKALLINAAEPQHFVFPWHGREQKIDASRPITSWRSAWRSIRRKAATNDEGEVIYPNLLTVRFTIYGTRQSQQWQRKVCPTSRSWPKSDMLRRRCSNTTVTFAAKR